MQHVKALGAALRRDPRHYQIAILSTLFVYGICFLDFEVTLARSALILAAALLTQFAFTAWHKLPSFDPRSALISGLSLCLLLRTNFLWLAVVAAAITVGSKFLIRFNGKHIFNPTNFGLVAMMLLTDQVLVSPGQWGSGAFFGFLIAFLIRHFNPLRIDGTVPVPSGFHPAVDVFHDLWRTALIVGRFLQTHRPNH